MRRHRSVGLIIITVFLFGCLCVAVSSHIGSELFVNPVSALSYATVILDAGHGGEDGGAVARDGTNEKDLNLQITGNAALFLDLFGIPYHTVREGDCLIGDNSLPTVRERKVSDIHCRMEIVNGYPDGILLSRICSLLKNTAVRRSFMRRMLRDQKNWRTVFRLR